MQSEANTPAPSATTHCVALAPPVPAPDGIPGAMPTLAVGMPTGDVVPLGDIIPLPLVVPAAHRDPATVSLPPQGPQTWRTVRPGHPLVAWLVAMLVLSATGCRTASPPTDRPFPLGQVTDSFWETQQTNAEAADFVFYDHEFERDTANLAPGAKKKLMSVALRLEHVPFPVVIEESPHGAHRERDVQRRQVVVEQLARLGVPDADKRVVVAPAFAEGITAVEGERAYYSTLYNSYGAGGGAGRRFGGFGGLFR